MKQILVVLTLLLVQCLSAQTSLQGKWKIDILVGLDETNEYKLSKPVGKHAEYGNFLHLNADGKFVSVYSAPCLNDCFTTNTGRYTITADSQIQFYLESVNIYGDCKNKSLTPNKVIGVFEIHEGENGFKLIRNR